jgi:hypothetical protein
MKEALFKIPLTDEKMEVQGLQVTYAECRINSLSMSEAEFKPGNQASRSEL